MDNGLGKSLSFRTGFGSMKLRAEMAFLFQDAVFLPLKAGICRAACQSSINREEGSQWPQVPPGCRGWDGWMASSTQWTWVWANSRRWWRTASLVCCRPWSCKESDTTEWLNKSNLLSTEPRAKQQSCQTAWALKPDCLLPILIQTLAGCVASGELFTLKHAKLT